MAGPPAASASRTLSSVRPPVSGAPTSITGFMSVSVKAAGWAMLIRLFMMMFPLRPAYVPFLVFVSIATMTGANFAALTQSNLKRMPRKRNACFCLPAPASC